VLVRLVAKWSLAGSGVWLGQWQYGHVLIDKFLKLNLYVKRREALKKLFPKGKM
jgi:hypothetical protein